MVKLEENHRSKYGKSMEILLLRGFSMGKSQNNHRQNMEQMVGNPSVNGGLVGNHGTIWNSHFADVGFSSQKKKKSCEWPWFSIVPGTVHSRPLDLTTAHGGFLKWGQPKMEGLQWKIPLKWLIYRYPHFRNAHELRDGT